MKYLLTILLISFTYLSFAQKFSTSIDVQIAVPQGDFKDVNADVGFGLRLNLLFKPVITSAVKFGIEFGIQEKGRATQYFSGNVFGFYDDFKESATDNIFFINAAHTLSIFKIWKNKALSGCYGGLECFFLNSKY